MTRNEQYAIPPLFAREKKLIAMLYAINEPLNLTDFQKLLFLYFQTSQSSSPMSISSHYEFVPYKFGAFSFSSYHDRNRLHSKGILESNDDQWKLTHLGKELAKRYITPFDITFAEENKHLRGDRLTAETYRKFPYYAINSEIKEKILRNDPSTLRLIDGIHSKREGPELITIGYERRTIEEYLNSLVKKSVDLLIDARKNALSRRYGFSLKTLRNACESLSIEYIHFPDLGIQTANRKHLATSSDYFRLFSTYKERLLSKKNPSLRYIYTELQKRKIVALTCYERDPEQCHRSVIAELLTNAESYNERLKLFDSSRYTAPLRIPIVHL